MQRSIEIQIANMSSALAKGNYTLKSIEKMRDGLIKTQMQLNEYKKDIEIICMNSRHILETCLSNTEFLNILTSAIHHNESENMSKFEPGINEIFKSHLMLYFFENKFPKTAIKYSEHVWGISAGIESKWFETSSAILESIESRQTSQTNSWMTENKNRLKKTDSKLEFLLQRQEFLKHVESKNFEEALKFAQKWPKIQSLMNPNLIEQLKTEELPKFLGLLVCSPEINTKCVSTERYADFLNPESMWSEVLNQFHRDNLQIFSDFSPSLLTLITVLGISLIKSNSCNQCENQSSNFQQTLPKLFDNVCPICRSDIRLLSKQIMPANWLISKIFCAATGKVADQSNPPYLAPSGFIYCKNHLDETQPDNATYVCSITSKIFRQTEFKKLYIM